jgi:hypothetical protein
MKKAVLLGFSLAVILGGCSKEVPAICRTTPPESVSGYDEWLRQYKAAHCEELLQSAVSNSAVN